MERVTEANKTPGGDQFLWFVILSMTRFPAHYRNIKEDISLLLPEPSLVETECSGSCQNLFQTKNVCINCFGKNTYSKMMPSSKCQSKKKPANAVLLDESLYHSHKTTNVKQGKGRGHFVNSPYRCKSCRQNQFHHQQRRHWYIWRYCKNRTTVRPFAKSPSFPLKACKNKDPRAIFSCKSAFCVVWWKRELTAGKGPFKERKPTSVFPAASSVGLMLLCLFCWHID